MKMAILANSAQKAEWPAKNAGHGVHIVWTETLEDLLGTGDADVFMDLQFDLHEERVTKLSKLLPKKVLVNAVIPTLEEIGHPFIRINAWPGFIARGIWEAVLPATMTVEEGQLIFERIGWPCLFVLDSPGMVSPRIISMIINEAYYTAEAGTSSPEEIDIAMKLGTHYPFGPFEWSRQIGLERIRNLLMRLREEDERYTICEGILNQKFT